MAIPPVSVLDSKPSRVMSFPLTVGQQLWLIFLIPSIVETIIYIIDLATDIAVGATLLREGQKVWGSLTIVFTYLPPFVCLIIRLSSPPKSPTFGGVIKWLVIELAAFILFPLRPISCFAERLVWAIEAVRLEDPERENALVEYERTRGVSIESYLFLQAYLHAGPQLILQIALIVWDISNNTHTNVMQGLCVITSVATLALVTTSYQRYESQCKGTRKRVWMASQPEGDKRLSGLPSDCGEAGVSLVDGGQSITLPRRVTWLRVTEEDNPFGKAVAFTFWFMLIVGRLLALVVAASFCPWAVLGVVVAHYAFNLAYILPTPDCHASIHVKIVLALIYVFCLVEVGIQFRKAYLLCALFFVFSCVEDLVLTLAWVLWSKWSGWWYHYALFVMAMTHVFALLAILLYSKYLKPKTRRVRPDGTSTEASD